MALKNKTRKGLKPADRPMTNARNANQWVANPRQELFVDYYLDPNSETFGNIYKSALKAGYSDGHAREFAAPSNQKQWLLENPRLKSYKLEHLNQKLQAISDDDRAKNSDKIKSIELLAKLKGYMIERKQSVSVVKVEMGKTNAPIED